MHNPSWNLFLDNVYTYAYCKNLFTKEECEQIIKIGKNKILIDAKTKEETKATIRCIPFKQNIKNLKCIFSGKEAKFEVIFAKSY